MTDSTSVSLELAAMDRCLDALSRLDNDARHRVIKWISERLGIPLGQVRTIQLSPTDHIVLTVDTGLSSAEREYLTSKIQEQFPTNPVMVLDGADIAVMRRAPIQLQES